MFSSDGSGSGSEYAYNDYGQVTRATNPNGNVTEYSYFASGPSLGYLQETVAAPGVLDLATRYTTDARGNVTAVTDPRGVRHTTVYNELDWRVASTQAASGASSGGGGSPTTPALGYTSSYLYDANGNLVTERQPFGETGSAATETRYTYGALSELVTTTREIEAGGAVTVERRAYDPNYNLESVIHPEGNETRNVYGPRNLLLSTTRGFGSPEAVVDSYVYNADRERTAYTNGRLQSFATEYDGYGRVARVVDPLGNATVSKYDANGNVVESEHYDPAGTLLAESAGEYDLLNRKTASLEALFDAGDPATEGILRSATVYDAASNVRQTTDALGRTTVSRYDSAERLVETIDPAGNRLVRTLDANGNATLTESVETTPDGGTVTVPYQTAYDALNRPVSRTDALGNMTRTAYDARSNAIRQTDAEGHVTASFYDGLDRRIRAVRPEGISIESAFDGNSRLTRYRDALGNETSWTYDALDRKATTTYPDQTSESYAYDGAGNVTQVADANGSTVTQTYDAANRLTARSVAAGPGIEGITTETYGYDGLSRVVTSESPAAVTSFAYDSLSRMTSESRAVGGGSGSTAKIVSYAHDRVGSVTRATYPSGHEAARTFDPLDRPLGVQAGTAGAGSQAVSYGYRGPDLVQTKALGNGVAGEMAFDGAKRVVGTSYSRPGSSGSSGSSGGSGTAFSETIAWSPRHLKVETTRADLGGRGLLLAYDGAGRVTAADSVPSPQTANNTTPAGGTGSSGGDGFAFAYDAAENLLSRSRSTGLGTETSSLPLDGSGRNRPGEVAGTALTYDANGNLVQKGNQRFHYDYRNRLARVSDAATGATVATYLYDNFNRRLAKTVETQAEVPKTTETVWGGWQNLEEYVSDGSGSTGSATRLASRRTYGLGLDEIVRQETDVDGDGTLETVTVPVYDSTGNLVLSTGPDGRTLERYEYTPYGGRTIFTDLTGPRLEQLRAVEGPGGSTGGGELWLELSEAALPVPLEAAATADTLTVSVDGAVETLTVSQPVLTGREARRRVVLALGTTPAAGAAVELTIPGSALVDESGNEASADITQSFTWPGAGSGSSGSSGSVVFDDTDPRVGLVSTYRDGNPVLTVQLSEEADLAAAATAITLDGAPTAWTLEADRYTLSSTASLPAGTHTLAVSTAALDLAGRGLTEPLELTFSVTANPSGAGCAPGTMCTSANTPFLYEGPKANQVATSTVGNAHGFHGRPVDPETGLVFVRNRFYDPEMGRFISDDPHLYSDGPNTGQFALNSPFVLGDCDGDGSPRVCDGAANPRSGPCRLRALRSGRTRRRSCPRTRLPGGTLRFGR